MSFADRLAGIITGTGKSETRATAMETRRPLQMPQTYTGPRAIDTGPQRIEWEGMGEQSQAIREFYYGNVWVYRGVRTIADSIGSLDWRVGRDPSKPESYDDNAPMAELLGPDGSPNDMFSSAAFWKHSIASYMTVGAFAWEKKRGPLGQVIAYWILKMPALRPIMAESGTSYFAGFKYGFGGNQRILRTEDVVYVYRPRLDDPRLVESPLEAAGLVIETDKMLHLMDYAVLKRGGPMILVEHEPFGDREQEDAFKSDFVENFTGSGNAGRPMFVQRSESNDDSSPGRSSAAIIPTGWSPKDMLLDAQKQAGKVDILAALGVPISMIGVTGEVTYQNGGWDRRNFWRETLKPIIKTIQDGVNDQTEYDFGREQRGWFDVTDILELRPEPPLAPADALAAFQANLITENEYREFLGMDPIPESEKVVPVVPDELADQTGLGADEQALESEVPGTPSQGAQQVGVDLPKVPKAFAQARAERRAKVLFANATSCDECKKWDGKGRGRYKYLLPHPNCKCDIEDLRTRHALLEAMVTQEAMLQAEMHSAISSIKNGQRGHKAQAEFQSEPLSALDMDKWQRRADEVFRGNLLQLGHWDDYQEVANERLGGIIESLESQGLFDTSTEGHTNDA